MEPTFDRGDLVVYIKEDFNPGDIVVYCLNPSTCIVHRFLDYEPFNNKYIITKGDANPHHDPPVHIESVRGKVVLHVPVEYWSPLFLLIFMLSILELIRLGPIGYPFVIVFVVIFVYLLTVYAIVPTLYVESRVFSPSLRLSGVYFDENNCSLRISYSGDLILTKAKIYVNQTIITELELYEREVILYPPKDLLRVAFEEGVPLIINISALLNVDGGLTGSYLTRIGGEDLKAFIDNEKLVVINPNCYPTTASISILTTTMGEPLWINQTLAIEGFSKMVIPQDNIDTEYFLLKWKNQGVDRWIGLPSTKQ